MITLVLVWKNSTEDGMLSIAGRFVEFWPKGKMAGKNGFDERQKCDLPTSSRTLTNNVVPNVTNWDVVINLMKENNVLIYTWTAESSFRCCNLSNLLGMHAPNPVHTTQNKTSISSACGKLHNFSILQKLKIPRLPATKTIASPHCNMYKHYVVISTQTNHPFDSTLKFDNFVKMDEHDMA